MDLLNYTLLKTFIFLSLSCFQVKFTICVILGSTWCLYCNRDYVSLTRRNQILELFAVRKMKSMCCVIFMQNSNACCTFCYFDQLIQKHE